MATEKPNNGRPGWWASGPAAEHLTRMLTERIRLELAGAPLEAPHGGVHPDLEPFTRPGIRRPPQTQR